MTTAAGRLAFRALVNESDTTALPDSVSGSTYQAVDYYIQCGLEELNRLIGYHVADDTSETVAVGTQEYDLSTDCQAVLWVELSGIPLARTSEEELRNKQVRWRVLDAGKPNEYFVYGRKLVLVPSPNAAYGTITIRHVSSPAAFSSSGFAKLADGDHNVPLLYAASLFLSLHGETPAMQERSKRLNDLFLQSVQAMQANYTAGRQIAVPKR